MARTHKRKKVALAFIADRNARRSTYRKRKGGLLKKIDEITTLCGVDACAIISSPFDAKPEIWPSPELAQRVVERYRMVPEMEKDRRTFNQQQFLRQSVSKLKKKLDRQLKDSYESELTEVLNLCLAGAPFENLYTHELHDLLRTIDNKLKDVDRVLESTTDASVHSPNPMTVSSVPLSVLPPVMLSEFSLPPLSPSLMSMLPTTLPPVLPSGLPHLSPLMPMSRETPLPVVQPTKLAPVPPSLLLPAFQQTLAVPNHAVVGVDFPWEGMGFHPNSMAVDSPLQMESRMVHNMMINPQNQMPGYEDRDEGNLAMLLADENYDFSLNSFLP